MANPDRRLQENAPGLFYVDDTCIDCDLCRQIAPETFRSGETGLSVVFRQPGGRREEHRAAMALVACPTGSIGTTRKIDLTRAADAWPERVRENVYFCGFSSRDSFGSSSYLILRPEGNVLVDSPRFASRLVRKIEDFGGLAMMFLTHRDDVADHEKFRRHFGCERVIHCHEKVRADRILEGSEPVMLAPDLQAIPTPGHTRGHMVLLSADRFLFSGDHLAWSPRYEQLIAFRRHNWYSWPETIRSMERLTEFRFEWVLPGHGRRAYFPTGEMRQRMRDCVRWMKEVA